MLLTHSNHGGHSLTLSNKPSTAVEEITSRTKLIAFNFFRETMTDNCVRCYSRALLSNRIEVFVYETTFSEQKRQTFSLYNSC